MWSVYAYNHPGNSLGFNHPHDGIDAGALKRMREDCKTFYNANKEDILCADGPGGYDIAGRAGHEFFLNRNGLGVGFWDAYWPEPHASRLADAARAYGEFNLYVGDDGLIYE